MTANIEVINRWRLLLGSFSEDTFEDFIPEGTFQYQEIDDLIDFLYGREYSAERDFRQGSSGSLDPSQLIVPEWISKIRKVFPKEVIERLENDALEKYQLAEILTDKKVLESMQPNMSLLKNILALKNRMKGDIVEIAKKIVRQVVEDLMKKLESDVQKSFMGKIKRNESTTFKISKNFDFKKTLRKNLKYYDNNLKTIIPQRIYFNPRIKRFNPWDIIICVDQSGSMVESVIYSAIMASIFAKLPILKISLVIFDTEVVDLSAYVDDPVDVLMSVQLGGGTDIGKAFNYCETLIETPLRTMMVVVTDLCDGAGYSPMYNSAKRIIESGAKLFILTGMDEQSQGMVDENAANVMAALGAKVASVTPRSLALWISESIK
jgi:predicted metal-dependent peptidase